MSDETNENTSDADPDHVYAPWDDQTVRNLNRFQQLPWVHPYTCGNVEHSTAIRLCATSAGWRCADPRNEGCEYTQTWASARMADPDRWPHGPMPAFWSQASSLLDKAIVVTLHGMESMADYLATEFGLPIVAEKSSDEVEAPEALDVVVKLPERWCCNGNAEECALCDMEGMSYPWICPGGHDETPINRRSVLMDATERGRDELRATMRRLRAYDRAKEGHVCETDHETMKDEDACEALRLAAKRAKTLVSHPTFIDVVDPVNGVAKPVGATSAIQAWADETDLAFALGSFGDGYRKAQHDAQLALGLDRAAVREAAEADPDAMDMPTLRAYASRRLLAVAVERIEREWICCDPVESDHDLCMKGAAARNMVTAILTDDEGSFPATSDVLDEVMRLIQGHAEPGDHRSVLSEAEITELYGKALLNAYREANADVGAEMLHTLISAVIATRDRELARNRQRLAMTIEQHRLALLAEWPPAVDAAVMRREERLKERAKVLSEVSAKLAEHCTSPIDEIAFHNTRLWLRRERKAVQVELDKRSES